jgi:hypothetical protein
VSQHRRFEVELDEVADPAQLRLRIGNQILVAQLQVPALQPARGISCVLDAPAPEVRGLGHRLVGTHAPRSPRECDVAAVADQVNEAGLGQE